MSDKIREKFEAIAAKNNLSEDEYSLDGCASKSVRKMAEKHNFTPRTKEQKRRAFWEKQ